MHNELFFWTEEEEEDREYKKRKRRKGRRQKHRREEIEDPKTAMGNAGTMSTKICVQNSCQVVLRNLLRNFPRVD